MSIKKHDLFSFRSQKNRWHKLNTFYVCTLFFYQLKSMLQICLIWKIEKHVSKTVPDIVSQERVDVVFSWKDSLFIITDFGVSKAILNFTDFSRRQCKLNFGPLRGHVKSCHFPERIEARRHFYFFIQISWQETTWTTVQTQAWIMLFGYKNT